MYKIKLLSRMAGPSGNYPEGSILETDKTQALELINGGYAQALEPIVEEEPKEEVKLPPKKKR